MSKLIRGSKGLPHTFRVPDKTEDELRTCKGILKAHFDIYPTRNALLQRAIEYYSRFIESASDLELEWECRNLMQAAQDNPRKPYERKKKNA